MKNILVTLDFTKDDELLLGKAFELAKAFHSKIWILHIDVPDPDYVSYDAGPHYIREEKATELRKEHKLLQDYAGKLIQDGVAAESLLIQGATIEMIIEESKKLDIDLIIAGHHDHGLFYKALAQSVSAGIIRKSKIPVLIVPLE